MLSSLPGDGDLLALTVDDGVNSDVVRMYTQFAKDTGVRLTYFVNGVYPSWTEHTDLLRPMVDDGQIQLANHTWLHPNLTKLPLKQVAEELRHDHDFLWKTYGVDARPYFRPPYGAHNAHVDKVAGDLGYTVNTLWSGDLGDQVVIPEAEVVKMAEAWFNPQAIVIGHLNHTCRSRTSTASWSTSSGRATCERSRSTTSSSSRAEPKSANHICHLRLSKNI